MDYLFPIEIFDYIFSLADKELLASMINNYFMHRYHVFDHGKLPINIDSIKKIKNVTYPINKNIQLQNILHLECLPNKDRYNLMFLRNCTSLQVLILPETNLRINNRCLMNITKLRILKLPSLMKNIDDLFNGMICLRELYLDSYCNQLNDGLIHLTNLQFLSLPSYNNGFFNNPFRTLTNLVSLNLYRYNHPLNDKFSMLTNLVTLNLYGYRIKLEDTVSALTKLEILDVGFVKDSINSQSLKNLTNLIHFGIHISFGENINCDLISEIKHLTDLRTLSLPLIYAAPISEQIVEFFPRMHTINFEGLKFCHYEYVVNRCTNYPEIIREKTNHISHLVNINIVYQ